MQSTIRSPGAEEEELGLYTGLLTVPLVQPHGVQQQESRKQSTIRSPGAGEEELGLYTGLLRVPLVRPHGVQQQEKGSKDKRLG